LKEGTTPDLAVVEKGDTDFGDDEGNQPGVNQDHGLTLNDQEWAEIEAVWANPGQFARENLAPGACDLPGQVADSELPADEIDAHIPNENEKKSTTSPDSIGTDLFGQPILDDDEASNCGDSPKEQRGLAMTNDDKPYGEAIIVLGAEGGGLFIHRTALPSGGWSFHFGSGETFKTIQDALRSSMCDDSSWVWLCPITIHPDYRADIKRLVLQIIRDLPDERRQRWNGLRRKRWQQHWRQEPEQGKADLFGKPI
jgi:hypothetical protein